MASRQQEPVERPQAYTLAFFEDGSIQVTADCNRAQGSFSVDAYSDMKLQVGPTTLAAWSRDSRREAFLRKINGISGYDVQEGIL